jgi:hypothetical protein
LGFSRGYTTSAPHGARQYGARDDAILHAPKRGCVLAHIGVSRRPDNLLFFGNAAAAAFDRPATSNLFVAGPFNGIGNIG